MEATCLLGSQPNTSDAAGQAHAAQSPWLSVCIPTYNRARLLARLLASVEEAAEVLSASARSRIEVLVSDNASTDATVRVVEQYESKFEHFVSWRNPRNLGAEGNIRVLLGRARGAFLWVVGDDDRLLPHALQSVCSHLRPGLGLLLLNYSTWDVERGRKLRANGRRLFRDEHVDDCDTLMRRHGVHPGYATSCVFNRKFVERLDAANYDRLAAGGFAFMYLIYSGLRKTSLFSEVKAAIYFENRADPQVSYDWYAYFIVGSAAALAALRREGYSARAERAARWSALWEFLIPRLGLEAKGEGFPRIRLLRDCVKCYKDLAGCWLVVLPVLVCPRALLRAAGRLAHVLRRPREIAAEQVANESGHRGLGQLP